MGGGSLLGKISNPSLVLLTSFSAFALLVLTSFFAFFSTFSTSSAFADPNGSASSTADVVVNLTSAISIRTLDSTASSEISALSLELTPSPTGRFIKDTTIVDVATSNATGYMLYMASDYTNLHTSTSSTSDYTTDMIHNDSSTASSYSIPTIDPTLGGVASATTISEAEFSMANSSYKNRWGYSLTEKNVAGTYKSIPAHNSPDTINSTVSTAVEHSYTPVTVGVNIDTNTASGIYTNELEFTAIANALPIVFTLSYAPNTGSGDTASNMPEPQTIATVSSQYTFTIPTTIPTTSQEGYVLKEWNTKPDGTGDSYQPGDEFTIIADSSLMDPGARTLYAIWEESNFWTITYMQDMTPEICASVKTPSNATGTNVSAVVLDTDGVSTVSGAKATYTVRNMADYNTLVTADNQPYVAQRTLYDIRDNNTYTIRKLADGNCWMTENLRLALSAGVQIIASMNNGSTFVWTPTSCGTNGICAMNGDTMITTNGGLYSWFAATAESDFFTEANIDAPASICPANWRLPANYTISPNKSYMSITDSYGATINGANNSYNRTGILEAFPLNFIRPGYANNGSYMYAGQVGQYWSSTAYDGNNTVHEFYYSTTYTYPNSQRNGYWGEAVRCVIR